MNDRCSFAVYVTGYDVEGFKARFVFLPEISVSSSWSLLTSFQIFTNPWYVIFWMTFRSVQNILVIQFDLIDALITPGSANEWHQSTEPSRELYHSFLDEIGKAYRPEKIKSGSLVFDFKCLLP